MRKVLFVLICCLLTAASVCMGSTYANFKVCISSQGSGSVCTLDAGTYYVPQNDLVIGRSNITVQGVAGVPVSSSILLRNSAVENMMQVAPNVSNVTIRYLSFDGRRATFNPSRSPAGYVDLEQASSTSQITITNCEFKDSPFYTLRLGGTGTTVSYSTFSGAVFSAIRGESETTGFNINSNTFTYTGGGAISIYSSYGTIQWNTFINNHREFPHNAPGGQVHIEGTGIVVYRNYLDGASSPQGSYEICGFETYGSDHTFTGNHVVYHTGPGISLIGVSNTTIDDYNQDSYVHWNNRYIGYDFPGIEIKTNSSYPTSSGILLNGVGVVDGHAYAITVMRGAGANALSLTIQNSCWGNNSPEDIYSNDLENYISKINNRTPCW